MIQTCQNGIRKVSELSEFGLGKGVNFPNLDWKSHGMRVTCIIILIILHTTKIILYLAQIILYIEHNILYIAQNILHISHNIFHNIRSYAMRPWNNGLDIKTSQK